MRLDRVVAVLPTSITAGAAVCGAVLAAHKVWPERVTEPTTQLVLVGAGVLVGLTALLAFVRKLAPHSGTMALDKHHDLSDRLTNAVAFQAKPEAERTALMEVAIDDACDHARGLKPGKASPIHFPSEFAVTAMVCLAVVGVALLEVRTIKPEPPVKTVQALVLSPDDIELFREAAKELERDDQSEDVKAAIDEFNRLIEDMANRRLDRSEAFRKMEAIERELLKGAEADAKALEEEFKETAKQLDRSDLAKDLAEALKKPDLDEAEKKMRELAERLRDKKNPPDKKQLEKLRQALEKAAKRRKEALAAVNEKRAAAQEQLLKKKKDVANAPPDKKKQEERLLKKKQRELERLDREAERRERAGRQLDRLDRELAEAAADLMKDLGLSAEDLDQAAEDINRMSKQQMSDEEKERLRQRLKELREILRQQKQGGDKRMARMLRFGKRARGQQGQGQGQEQKGQGQQGQGQQGQEGQGPGDQPGGVSLSVGPGGQIPIDMPGAGQSGNQKGNGGDSPEAGGKGIGKGSGGNPRGEKTNPDMDTHDVEAVGADAGDGPSNSQVILAAAERGFKGESYKKVFTQYRTVAEENINKDTIPDGYRFYIQRYFQLIRPRE